LKHPAESRSFTGENDEIITALSRITWLFVIARNSSVRYKGQAIDAKQVARRPAPSRPAVAILGVRFGSTAVDPSLAQ
jgi:TolB-like protein